MNFTVDNTLQWLEKTNKKFQENKHYLTKLDQPIGDGDHGIHMAQGFNEVVKTINEKNFETVGDIMYAAAMTMIGKIGGAAGSLFGTAFLKMSVVFQDRAVIDYAVFVEGFEAALTGLKSRGKSKKGEKTLIDVWAPVVKNLQQMDDLDADQLVETAKLAMENTKNTAATKGRAAYFKEKSIGHIDPGAASSFYLFEALAEVVKEGK